MGRPVAFFEITSTDAPRAQRFYAELFDWTVTPDESMGGYALVDTADNPYAGGIGPSQAPGDTGVKVYVRVDLDGYLKRAEALGGTTLVPQMDLPGEFGRYAVFADPDGNPVGLWA